MDSIKVEVKEKDCSQCSEIKQLSEFGTARGMRGRYGCNSICRKCCAKRTAIYREKNRDSVLVKERARFLKTYYKISVDVYERMYAEQLGVCCICRGNNLDGKRLSVDHCHKTGVIRGLLCKKCNTGIGYFNDDTDLMQKAIDYLLNSKQRA